MRAVEIAVMVVCFSLAVAMVNEMDLKYYQQYNRYLIGYSSAGPVNVSDMQDTNLNNTLDSYGANKVPAGLANSPYLLWGGGMIDGIKMFFDFISTHTIGIGSFFQRAIFPDMLPSMSYAISVLMFIINIVAVITIIRGVYVGR